MAIFHKYSSCKIGTGSQPNMSKATGLTADSIQPQVNALQYFVAL